MRVSILVNDQAFRLSKKKKHKNKTKQKCTLMYLLPRVSQFHLGSVATIYESKLRTLRNTNKIPSIFSNTCQLNHKFKNKKRNKTFTFSVTAKIKEKVLPSHCHWCKGRERGGKEERKKINKINCVRIRILFHSIAAQEEEYFHFLVFFFIFSWCLNLRTKEWQRTCNYAGEKHRNFRVRWVIYAK